MKEKDIDIIQSITLEDIYKNLFDAVEKDFKDHMNMLLQGVSNIRDRSMLIFYTQKVEDNYESAMILRPIEKWSKIYSEEQTGSYKLVVNNETFTFFFYPEGGIVDLVKAQIHEFKINRDPIILYKETETKKLDGFLKPISFVNIGKLVKVYCLLRTDLLL